MMHRSQRSATMLVMATIAFLQGERIACADSLILNPVKDNTLIEDPKGLLSNGSGDVIFSGRVGLFGGERNLRAVLAFDLSDIPSNATITSATLTLNLLQTVSGDQVHAMHRLTADWGEGASVASGGTGTASAQGDATWVHTYFANQYWNTAGGDFAGRLSAVQTVGSFLGDYAWTSKALAADVQDWLNNPKSNFGWIVIGNEAETFTSKKFASRENVDPAIRPRLEIEFTVAAPCPADITQDQQVNANDLLAVINAWGACPPPCPASESCSADVTQDCVVNANDLLVVINSWGPCP